MKALLIIGFIFSCVTVFAQPFEDTLYYNSGWDRPVTILSIKNGKIVFLCDGKKGTRQTNSSLSALKGYKSNNPEFKSNELSQYDSDQTVAQIDDTLDYLIRPGLLSISPVDLAFIGVGMDYSWRFGPSYHSALHVPFRATTIAAQTTYLSIGVGYSYFVRSSSNTDFYLTTIPTLFSSEGERWGAMIIGLGGVRYFNETLALNGYFGVGPTVGNSSPIWFDFQLGIGFRLGTDRTGTFKKSK